jgi:phosphomannomutase
MHTALAEAVQAWIDDDPDPQTAQHLTDLLDLAGTGNTDETMRSAARSELADRFAGFLAFGTAGLRGALGGGPNRMNRAVVIRTASGLMRYLTDALGDARPRVVIGYDARYMSHTFAHDTAAVVTAAGGQALLLPRPLPTPVLAFAVRHLDADAGVMVTASHNPAQDNGYKVYLGGRVVAGSGQGAQIVAPYDAEIATRIAAVPSVASVARAGFGWTVLNEDVVEDYLATVRSLAMPGPRDLRIVLTPLHGVGGELAQRVLADAGFTDVHIVLEQAMPDPAFPTVAFPNPEEPGAIDLALALAHAVDADLVIAHDPDADRCAAAVRDARAVSAESTAAGSTAWVRARAAGWRMLHGDEVGALLGADAAARMAGTDAVLANSIVSSRLLAQIAAGNGLKHRSTLTGFKWISRIEGLAYGYEEALGYCTDPADVRDKDGLSAALVIAQLAARAHADGRTLIDLLDDLAVRYGLYLTDQLSARLTDAAQITAIMDRVRAEPPTTLAGSPVVEVTDLSVPGTGPDALPPTDGLRLLTDDGTRVVIRPSGTEPKVKCYLEVITPVAPEAGDDPDRVGTARRVAREHLTAVREDVTIALGL